MKRIHKKLGREAEDNGDWLRVVDEQDEWVCFCVEEEKLEKLGFTKVEETQRDWIDDAQEMYGLLLHSIWEQGVVFYKLFRQAIEKHQPPQLLPLDVEKIMREISINSYRDSPTENNVVTVYWIRGILSKYWTQQVTREEIEKLAVGKSVIIPDSLWWVARWREKLLEIPKVIDLLRSKWILKE